MIVITSPIAISNEIKIIHSLFEEGLSFLHIRKPDFSETEMESFLLEIGLEYRNRLVLHSHHHLAKKRNINQLHFSEKERRKISKRKLCCTVLLKANLVYVPSGMVCNVCYCLLYYFLFKVYF